MTKETFTLSYSAIDTLEKCVNLITNIDSRMMFDVVFMSLLLTHNIFDTFSSASTCDLEHVFVCWESF